MSPQSYFLKKPTPVRGRNGGILWRRPKAAATKSPSLLNFGLFACDPSAGNLGRLYGLKRRLFFTAAALPPQ
jgi:hypothetical protein